VGFALLGWWGMGVAYVGLMALATLAYNVAALVTEYAVTLAAGL
jgi:hypothetical protein